MSRAAIITRVREWGGLDQLAYRPGRGFQGGFRVRLPIRAAIIIATRVVAIRWRRRHDERPPVARWSACERWPRLAGVSCSWPYSFLGSFTRNTVSFGRFATTTGLTDTTASSILRLAWQQPASSLSIAMPASNPSSVQSKVMACRRRDCSCWVMAPIVARLSNPAVPRRSAHKKSPGTVSRAWARFYSSPLAELPLFLRQ